MHATRILGFALLLTSTAAMAQKSLPTVEVRADGDKAMVLACARPEMPKIEDVNRVLGVTDTAHSKGLRKQLMAAAAEACSAGKSRIQVARTGSGSLSWKPLG